MLLEAALPRLSIIREALLKELSGNTATLRFINTRLILSINVNLFAETAAEDMDQKRSRAAMETLHKMGFLKSMMMEGNRGP